MTTPKTDGVRRTPATLDEKLDRLAESLTRASVVFPKALRTLRDAFAGQPSAQSFDEAHQAGHTSRKFCDNCGNDPAGCKCPEHPSSCTCDEHKHIVTVPGVSDITGEAATTFDPARNTHRRIAHLIRNMERDAGELIDHVDYWNPVERTTLDRGEKLDLEGSNRPKCEVHLRFGHDRDALRQATRVKHKGRYLLEQEHRLCEWCIDVVQRVERLPTQTEVNDHVNKRPFRMPVEDDRPGWKQRLNGHDTDSAGPLSPSAP